VSGLVLAAAVAIGAVAWGVAARPEQGRTVWNTSAAAHEKAVPAETSKAKTSKKKASEKPKPQSTRPGKRQDWPENRGRPGPHGTPAPFTQTFAAQPGVTRQKPRRSPTTPVRVAPTVDGCDHNYGARGQCIPVTYPEGTTSRCAWLHDHGFDAVKVVGADRQKLDPDKNGVACEK
jgi:hypothetical protein